MQDIGSEKHDGSPLIGKLSSEKNRTFDFCIIKALQSSLYSSSNHFKRNRAENGIIERKGGESGKIEKTIFVLT